MKKKSLIILILCLCLLINTNTFSAVNSISSTTIVLSLNNPYMVVNGVEKEIDPGRDTCPLIVNGRTLLPISSLIKYLGGSIEWNDTNKQITLKHNSNEILLNINNTEASINNKKKILDVPPLIINSRTMLPVRFISETIGYDVFWDNTKKSITIKGTSSKSIPKTQNIYHYVTPGESLWKIANDYNTTIEKIKSFNNLSSDIIYIGQTLLISLNDLNTTAISYSQDENLLKSILSKGSSKVTNVLSNLNKYEVQIMYTEIDRTNTNPTFTTYNLNVNSKNYFYPASSIKLPMSVIALDKINNLNIPNLSKKSILNISSYKGQSGESGKSIEDYIKSALLYSDNNSFDRLYEFVGQKDLNETLWKKGFYNSLIIQRLGIVLNTEYNRYTNPMSFYSNDSKIFYQNSQFNPIQLKNENLDNLKRGKYIYLDGKITNGSKDFSYKNNMSLENLQNLLKTIVFNKYIPKSENFNLSEDDLKFLMENIKNSNSNQKYFICGGKKNIPKDIEIYNKTGQAYGNLIDNAYILNKKDNVEFLLTAVIYVNENNIIGDNVYEYYSIGLPFLEEVGTLIYDYNKSIKKGD